MDLGLLLAMVLSFVLAVVVVRTIGEIWTRHLRLKERQLDAHAKAAISGDDPDRAARAERIERRLQVLERIATDRGQDLAREIEDLRAERELAR